MTTTFQYRPRFVDIRVKPPKPGEEERAQDVNALKPGERACDHQGCRLAAATRAPNGIRVDATLSYSFEKVPLRPKLAMDIINLFDAHYAYRIANGFVGSSYAAPRSVFVRLAFPLAGGRP